MLHSTIVLGPALDLHAGIHGSLLETPPRPYRYVVRPAHHVFAHAHAGRRFSPLTQRHWAELLDFGPGHEVVHSAWWPVLARQRWVVELDDLGYPAYAGRHAIDAAFARQFHRSWPTTFRRDIVTRVEVMLAAYAHPSCAAIIFQTRAALERARRGLFDLGLGHWSARLTKKSVVIHPAATPLARRTVTAKWRAPTPLKVLFCGRDYDSKDGALALRVVARLLGGQAPFQFRYVGTIPPPARREFADVLARIEVFESLARRDVIRLMSESHVLFHPSPSETVGMVFIEAAAAGLAVVASRSAQLTHLHELLPGVGARSVDREGGSPGDHEARFVAAIASLLARPARARRMALANYERALTGSISSGRRNAALAALYRTPTRAPGPPPLTLAALLPRARWASTRLDEDRLARLIGDYRRRRRVGLSVVV